MPKRPWRLEPGDVAVCVTKHDSLSLTYMEKYVILYVNAPQVDHSSVRWGRIVQVVNDDGDVVWYNENHFEGLDAIGEAPPKTG
jgi:hypothetical protein